MGATKLFVEEGIPVDEACAVEVTTVRDVELVVDDAWFKRGVGVIVAEVDVKEALEMISASSSHGPQSSSSFSSWAIGSPEMMVAPMARRAQRCVIFLAYMIASPA